MWSQELVHEIELSFNETVLKMGAIKEKILPKLESLNEEQKIIMKFIYSSMPFNDILEYPFELYLQYADHGIYLRKNMAWCKNVPERIFLNDVVFYRVNSENITDCRQFFYEMLRERISKMTMEEAVIELNYWCCEQATYQASDYRTASPLTVYWSGIGRCGEESTFAVSVLRSMGIPARQIYTPAWAHCDDNHAWVEAWCDGKWYFFGACEPDPKLNMGWFTGPASRAMLIHCRNFANFKQENAISKDGLLTFTNNTSLYGQTNELNVSVVDKKNSPVQDAKVQLEILNMAGYRRAATLFTDEKGHVSITLGLGDILVHVSKDNVHTSVLWNNQNKETLIIHLDEPIIIENRWRDYTIHAPKETLMHPVDLTEELKEDNKKRIEYCEQARNERIGSYYNEALANTLSEEIQGFLKAAKGNFHEIYQFVTKDNHSLRIPILKELAKKDYFDIQAEVLETHLVEAASHYENSLYKEDIFTKYILSPRIAYENITPYRGFILSYFSKEEKAAFIVEPKKIITYIKNHLTDLTDKDYQLLILSPRASLESKFTNAISKKVLFVAICRSLGIPARLDPVDGTPQYYQDGQFYKTEEEAVISNQLNLKLVKEEGSEWHYYQTFTLSKLKGNHYVELDFSENNFENNELDLEVEPGSYRIITANRIPSGDILASEYLFTIDKEGTWVELHKNALTLEHLETNIPMPNVTLLNEEGETNLHHLLRGKTLVTWLEEGKEPTEHILNELLEQQERLRLSPLNILFILKNKDALKNQTLWNTLKVLPKIQVYYETSIEDKENVAKLLSVATDKLPLVAVVNDKKDTILASSGYNVGIVDQALKVIEIDV